jgi:glutamate-1-semialdehyde 2,1-aminomutase
MTASSRAKKYLVGGVNSPVRAFTAVHDSMFIASHARGPFIYDENNSEYIDLCMSWGPLILGHAHPAIIEAIIHTATCGTTFGMTAQPEIDLAELICNAVPSIENLRMTSSGTEAVMTAVRLARGVTQRNKIVLFDGGYHGHADAVLATGGSAMMTHAQPASPGIPPEILHHTLIAPYNDCAAVDALLAIHADDLAAIIVEPIAGNMGLVTPEPLFLADRKSVV